MSGEDRRTGRSRSWLLPVLIVLVGAGLLYTYAQRGMLRPVKLGTVQWVGIALMVPGALAAVLPRGADGRRLALKLGGLVVCALGALMVIGL